MLWILYHKVAEDRNSRTDWEEWGVQRLQEGFSKDPRMSAMREQRDSLVQPDHCTDGEIEAWCWSGHIHCWVGAELPLEPRSLGSQAGVPPTSTWHSWKGQELMATRISKGICLIILQVGVRIQWQIAEALRTEQKRDFTQRFNTYIPVFSTYINSWYNFKKEENE